MSGDHPAPQNAQSSHSQHHEGPTLVYFIAFGMLIGAICRLINKKTKFPYTPLLLIVGLMLGHFRHILGIVGQGTDLISKMNPHMILFIFIPILIFESGFNCDWYVFKKALLNILLLAAPGVLWGAILIGFCFKTILGYPDEQLTWYQAFTLGCVLSATDPVAVVALLKQLGASLRFNTLIQGESLLNDGTAMVFFLLFLDLAKGNATTPVQVVANFIRIGLGGPLLGVIVGVIASYFLKKVIRDDLMTANITFIACYFCFWIAEYTWVKVSGILSLVVLGLFMSAVAKTRIYPESQHSLHTIWSYIQYVCETTIFLLTGIIIGVQLMEKSTIQFSDWTRMFFFYILMNICRLIMCLTFLPILRANGYGVSMKEFVVLVYGGLRGALGLCLALLVAVDGDLSVRFRQITIFYMGGMATLTLLINGTTCGKLVNYVQMIEKPPIKDKLFKRCLNQIIEHTNEKIQELKIDRFLQLVDWKKVQFYLNDKQLNQKIKEIDRQSQRKSQHQKPRFSRLQQHFKSYDIQTQLRYKSIKFAQNIIWQRFQHGQCQENAAKLLHQVCMVNIDFVSSPMVLWQNLTPSFTSFKNLTLWMNAQSWPVIGKTAHEYTLIQLYSIYQVACNLIIALQQTKENMQKFPIAQQYHTIEQQMNAQIQKAESYLIDMQTQFPEMIGTIQMKKAVCTILKQRKQAYDEYCKNGFIDEKQLKEALVEVDQKLYSLENLEMGLPNFNKYNLQYPIFAFFNEIQMQNVINQSYLKKLDKGVKLYDQSEQIKEIYVIVQGGVADTIRNQTIVRGMGGLLSPANILSRNGRSYSTAIATGPVQVRAIPFELMKKLMQNPMFRFKVFTASVTYFVKLYKQKAGFLGQLEQNRLNQYVRKSALTHINYQDQVVLDFGGYLFEGEVQIADIEQIAIHENYSYLPPGKYINIVKNPISILKFKQGRPKQKHAHHNHVKRQSILQIEDHHEKPQIYKSIKLLDKSQLYERNINEIQNETLQPWHNYNKQEIEYILYLYYKETTQAQQQSQVAQH